MMAAVIHTCTTELTFDKMDTESLFTCLKHKRKIKNKNTGAIKFSKEKQQSMYKMNQWQRVRKK